MASRSHKASEGRKDLTGLICLAEALTFARLAAASGCDRATGNTAAILHDIAARIADMGEPAQSKPFRAQADELEQTFT